MQHGEEDLELKIFKTLKEISAHTHRPGEFVTDGRKYFKIATQDGFVQALELQLQGRKRMSVADFLNGLHLEPTLPKV